jgi:hypothetical protein
MTVAGFSKVKMYKTTAIGLDPKCGGEWSAFCDDHNQFIQGTWKSLVLRYTFEVCSYCEEKLNAE